MSSYKDTIAIPVNIFSSVLVCKCRRCHASTGMTGRDGVRDRTPIRQIDGGYDHDGYPYCTFVYKCCVCSQDVFIEFSNNPDYRISVKDSGTYLQTTQVFKAVNDGYNKQEGVNVTE